MAIPRLKEGFNGERVIVLPRMIVRMMEEDPLLSLLHITDIGYYPCASHHYRERQQPINQYVLIYCVEGRGRYAVGGEEHEVHADQFFILPAGVPHCYGADEGQPWTIYWIHFKGTAAACYGGESYAPIDIKPEAHSRIGDRIRLFEEMFHTLQDGFSNENLKYVSSMMHYFLGTIRYVRQFRNANHNGVNDGQAVDVAIHWMKENIEKTLALKDIADYVGYSQSHFSMLFKKITGHAPIAYFNLTKVQYACNMLETTDMRIKQISYKVGVRDTYYFTRLFTKIMGMSPKEYRKTKKG